MLKKKSQITPLQILVHVGAWYPLLHLGFDYLTGRMSINPIQEIEQHTGLAAVFLLVLSLACTPLSTVLGWREAIKRRKALGLYGFAYTVLHMGVYVALDFSFLWSQIWFNIVNERYLLVGTLAVVLLIPLAVTSFQYFQKSMGKNWKRLHNLVYLIVPMAVLHYAWSKKGDLFHLRGDILYPLIYALVVILLLALRLPFMRRLTSSWRRQLTTKLQKILARVHQPPKAKPSFVNDPSTPPQEGETTGG
ncbi:MAG: protein-methionine-sulfoxide reductase heme-binding subunit MsrQ [Anaerolineales bacterium]|jgi:sulfoxide reductase heme-binding subunit YedZ